MTRNYINVFEMCFDKKYYIIKFVSKEENGHTIDVQLILKNFTVEDAGKYKVTARNNLGEYTATISLNFDSKLL